MHLGPKDYGKIRRQIKIHYWSAILWWGGCTTLHPLCINTGFGPLTLPSQRWDSGSLLLCSPQYFWGRVTQGAQSERLLAIGSDLWVWWSCLSLPGDTCTLRSQRYRHHPKQLQGGVEISPLNSLWLLCWRRRWMAECFQIYNSPNSI